MASRSSGMPATGVYFVSPRLIASMAACLILSGVSKSGSPAPRPITSLPLAFSSRAFWLTAMVAEGLTRERASARNAMIVLHRWQDQITGAGHGPVLQHSYVLL